MNTKEYVNQLVNENINIVGFVLNKWYKNFETKYPELVDDLYQEGCIGLFRAAKIYDENKGRFSTIAVSFIRWSMNSFIERYVKKHYENNNCSIDVEVYNNGNAGALKLIDTIPSYDKERDHRIEIIETRARYSNLKNIEIVLNMTKLGYSQREIAKHLDISQVEVSRKLKKLRQEYEIRSEFINKIQGYKVG